MNTTEVILVTEGDEPLGTMEKMEAHRKGVLHRAFSVFVFDRKGDLLIQQRAAAKYHGAHLWSNTCCSHPFPGEMVAEAAARRLSEEMGFATPLQKIFSFVYRAPVENGLVEHEFDHVFAGIYEGHIQPDENEVAGYRYEAMDRLKMELETDPARFTSWFRIVFPRIEDWHKMHFNQQKVKA